MKIKPRLVPPTPTFMEVMNLRLESATNAELDTALLTVGEHKRLLRQSWPKLAPACLTHLNECNRFIDRLIGELVRRQWCCPYLRRNEHPQ